MNWSPFRDRCAHDSFWLNRSVIRIRSRFVIAGCSTSTIESEYNLFVPSKSADYFNDLIVALVCEEKHCSMGLSLIQVVTGEHLSNSNSDKNPKDLDEAFVKYEARIEDGTIFSKSDGVEFSVGEGYFCPALSKALKTMKKGEKNDVESETTIWFNFGTVGLFFKLRFFLCEPPQNKNDKMSYGKTVYTDYSAIEIPGDGRCLFRSIAHGACVRTGKAAPSESLQREIADELRAGVVDEFVKRREEPEWFIEGDLNTYVAQIRKPHVWGGEPELLMLSHVLMMPITVYMCEECSGGLISIAEYGQEYGKEDPIRVLYHGFGHYDALLMPGNKATNPDFSLVLLNWSSYLPYHRRGK